MSEGNPWIATFVQETLSEYLGQVDQRDIQVEDDGANLTFDNRGRHFTTHVKEWGVGPSGHGAVLQDTEHQVDVVIPEELLSLYDVDSSTNRSKAFNPKHYPINLLEFKLVFAYTTAPIQIHFFITKFHINRENGKGRNFQPKKKLIRNFKVKSLLEATRQHAQGTSKVAKSDNPGNHIVGRVEFTHSEIENQPLFSDKESQQISSQIPNDNLYLKHVSQASPIRLRGTNELLRHLGPSSPRARDNTSLQRDENLRNGRNGLKEVPINAIGSIGDEQHLTTEAPSITRRSGTEGSMTNIHKNRSDDLISDDEGSISSQTRKGATTPSKSPKPLGSSSPEKSTPTGPGPFNQNKAQSPSKKRPREGTATSSHLPNSENQILETGDSVPPKKRQRTSPMPEISLLASQSKKCDQFEKGSSVTQTYVTVDPTPVPSRKIVPTQVSPWTEFNGLKARDVNISMEQQELLDDNNLRWIPPRPNDSLPRGHLPPSLLKMWNNAVQRRPRNGTTPETSPWRSHSRGAGQVSPLVDHEAVTIVSTSVSSRQVVPAGPSPWEGFTGIKACDVTIPKDQKELFHEDKLCWIPPRPTEPLPQGQVPPPLLKMWNDSVNRRHRKAKSPDAAPERPIDPSQESDACSAASASTEHYDNEWSSSPERSPSPALRPLLPPSSPLEQSSPAKKLSKLTRKNDEQSDLPVGVEYATDVNPSHKGPASESRSNRGSSEITKNQSQEASRSLEPASNLSPHTRQSSNSRQHSPLHEPERQDPLSQPSSAPAPNQELAQKYPTHSTPMPPSPVAQENDSDEESVMDTCVPIALGENIPELTQFSQVEEELTSSGPSLPRANGECIQVAVSPLVDNNHRHRDASDKNINMEHTTINRFSSQPHKTSSSQSRILNTYPSHESQDGFQSSHETSNTEEQSQGMHVEVNVPLTQLQSSSMASQPQSQSQQIANHSQSDIILDSSEPAQRHQDMSHVTQQPSLELTTSHGYPEKGDDQNQNSQSAHLLDRREGFISKHKNRIEAQEVFQEFCSSYSDYSGDFDHFKKMCRELSDMRQQGKLQRSFLWDDFIIMDLKEYPKYCHDAFRKNSQKLDYKNYFLETFSRPCYKKRCLTTKGIESVASQLIAKTPPSVANTPPCPASSQIHGLALKTSFTGSLIDRFTNLQAHSFNDLPQGDPSTPVLGSGHSSRASSVQIKCEGDERVLPEFMNTQASPTRVYNERPQSSISDPKREPTSQTDVPNNPFGINSEASDVDTDMEEIPETDPEDIDEQDDTLHETASVELGDESFGSPARSQSHAACKPTEDISNEAKLEEDPESERDNENWFLSLRHIRPQRGVWSDGPTEFKHWAKADQNVLSERLHRGGAEILLDDHGVIRRPTNR